MLPILHPQGAICQTVTEKKQSLIFSTKAPQDSIIVIRKELSLTKKFENRYKRNEQAATKLSPHFIKEISSPNKSNSIAFLNHMKLGAYEVNNVKRVLIASMKKRRVLREAMSPFITDSADFVKYTIRQIPTYYLSPNVVNYKDGDNIAEYYQLETAKLKYMILKGKQLIGFMNYANGESTFYKASKFQIEAYSQIESLTTNPVALKQVIAVDPANVGGDVSMFGYVTNGRLIFSFYEEGYRSRENEPNKVIKQKIYTLQVAEAFFAGNPSFPILQQWINGATGMLKNK